MAIKITVFLLIAFFNTIYGTDKQFPVDDCAGTVVNCFAAPCSNAKCPKYPDAVCMNDYCDGCNAKFFDKSDSTYQNELNCGDDCEGDSCGVTCANVRCPSVCLDTVAGPKCCPLDKGCSSEDYDKNNCLVCHGKEYKNECLAACVGVTDPLSTCSPCNCKTAGCSGELCVDKDSEVTASICIFKCEYKCNQYKKCKKTADGTCQWVIHDTLMHDKCVEECGQVNANDADNKICACQDIYNPICCNGKTYSNPCGAECDGVPKPAHSQDVCAMGKCEQKICACQAIYDPYCCNGKEFDNSCTVTCYGLDVADCQHSKCPENGPQ